MTIFDLFAHMGLLVGDVFAAIALLGTAMLFLSVASGRRMRKTPQPVWTWAMLGTFLGLLCFGSLLLTQLPAQRIGFIFGWSPSLVGGLLALAVALLGMSAALSLARRG